MIGVASRRRAAAAVVLAWCVALAALAVDEPLPALAEHPGIVHPDIDDTGIADLECDQGTTHSSGGACYTHTHSVHRRLDTYREEQYSGFGWSPTGVIRIKSCETDVEDDEALDHGMGASLPCEAPDPPDDSTLRWTLVSSNFTGSGHNVTWHESTTDTTNVAPVFQPATILQDTVTCCGGWTTVATLRALDADVVQVSGVWQDDLRFASRSSDSNLGVSRLANARFLSGGGGVDVDVELSGLSPGTVYITVDVRDLRETATDTIVIGPFTILAEPNQAPTVDLAGVTVVEGQSAVLTLEAVSGFDGGSGSVTYTTQDGSAVADADYVASEGSHSLNDENLSVPVIVATIDDDVVEGSETFTVQLSNASGVVIGAGSATVTITDNDSDSCPEGTTGTPPNCVPTVVCPEGTTGTPPNCVPTVVCPEGTTGTPPNCVPTVVEMGCAVPATRLTALSVTGGGSELLNGFSATTYFYTVSTDRVSVQVTATAAESSASLRIGAGGSGTGSATHTVYMSQGSTVTVDVVVSVEGESCTYTLSVTRPAPPATDCPAWSGQVLVAGVCVEACPGADQIPNFDSNGDVVGCLLLGDCPHELYGLSERPTYRVWAALWPSDRSTIDAVGVGAAVTATRTAVKCRDIWRLHPSAWSEWPNFHTCIWDERNLTDRGDCLHISMDVEAVIPAVEADSSFGNWAYMSSSCGNRSAPRVDSTTDPWEAGDAICSSTSGSWTEGYCASSCSDIAPTNDPGTWTVTLDTEGLAARGVAYVDVPIQISVTDWGEASHLRVNLVATPTYVVNPAREGTYAQWSRPAGQVDRSARTSFEVPRLSGPIPADDVIEVYIADVSELPYVSSCVYIGGRCYPITDNQQFVEILRTTLLANDACPVGTDCTDPLQWPVRIDNPRSAWCSTTAFHTTSATAPFTGQGLVGCDNLNGESRSISGITQTAESALYWPRLWGAGEDTFTYATYGGPATVTIKFTDQVPVAPDITTHDPGTSHTIATFDSPIKVSWWVSPPGCGSYACSEQHFAAVYTRTDTEWAATHHAGRVSLEAVRDSDPDADAATVVISDGHNPHLTGRSGIIGDPDPFRSGGLWWDDAYSHWKTDDTERWTWRGCYLQCPTAASIFAGFISGANSGGHHPVNLADGTQSSVSAGCVAGTDTTTTRPLTQSQWYPSEVREWSSAAATDPGCEPSIPDECDDSTQLAEWSLCYALWPDTANPAPLTVDYRACDVRLEAARSDVTAFAQHLLPYVAPSLPQLTESEILHLIRHRAAGNSSRPGYPHTYTQAQWEAAVAVIDPQLHSRYCATGTVTVTLGACAWQPTATQLAQLAAQVQWHSFLEAGPTGPAGAPWPPHPEVPGGDAHIVIANSPMWPRIVGTSLEFTDDADCDWTADGVQAQFTQMLPWNPTHRAAVQAHGGFAQWLGVWDRLGAARQAQAQALHTDGDLISGQCPIAAAADPTEPSDQNQSYQQCSWSLVRPGLWHWTLDAEFTDGSQTVVDTLAEDITWFRSFDAYTVQQTFTHTGSSQED